MEVNVMSIATKARRSVIGHPAIITHPIPSDTLAHALAPSPRIEGTGGFLSREHILEATEACFAESGYDGTTIRAIAGRLGCAVGSIYRYFADKRDLLLAMTSRLFAPVIDTLDTGADLAASIEVYVQTVRDQEDKYRLMMWLAGWNGAGASPLPEALEPVLERWAGLLGNRKAAELVWAQLHGLLTLGCDAQEIAGAMGRWPRGSRAEIVQRAAEQSEEHDRSPIIHTTGLTPAGMMLPPASEPAHARVSQTAAEPVIEPVAQPAIEPESSPVEDMTLL
jgi:AcrR family transcriptional regulator